MDHTLSFSQFLARFPTDESCLDEIKKLRYPNGVFCVFCKRRTKHYKVKARTAYACAVCRHQIYPLSGTLFAKTTTPLRLWFYAMFLMTHTRANMSRKQLQRELGVTYKTAWRIYTQIRILMAQNNGDLLFGTSEERNKVRKWTFFNKFEITLTEKQQSTE